MTTIQDSPGEVPLPTYDEYAAWHAVAEKRVLEPARLAAVRLLTELLDSHVPELDRPRFRISSSRVKSPQRSYTKLSLDKYRKRFRSTEQVPDVIDDLVGLRLICNNLSDINTFQEIIGELPLDDGTAASFAVEAKSQRDYFAEPKLSGYRAFHVNFVVPVPQAKEFVRLRVEVQVRTLLQDGWGELTHEDTYKPGSTVPDWIVAMARRMAELLAAVDNIAQDLRTGLDVETQERVESEEPELLPEYPLAGLSQSGTSAPESLTTGSTYAPLDDGLTLDITQLRAALIQETLAEASAIKRPTALALISQNLVAKFGNEITRTWGEYGGFRKFLLKVVPNIQITGPSPGYVHPLNEAPPTDWEVDFQADQGSTGLPGFVRTLRVYDKGIPMISTLRMSQLVEAVAEVLAKPPMPLADNGRLSNSQIDELSKLARDVGDARGQLVVRPHAAYVLQTLSSHELLRPGITGDQIKLVLTLSFTSKAERHGLVRNRDEAKHELEVWLGVSPTP